MTSPRLLIVFVKHGQSYPGALERLSSMLDPIWLPKRLVIVDNAESASSRITRLADWRFEVPGDNGAFEFSGWQKGLDCDPARSFDADVILFANSSFVTHRFHSMPLLDAAVVGAFADRPRLGGVVRQLGYPADYRGLDLSQWIITHLFLANAAMIRTLGSLVTFPDPDRFLTPLFQQDCLTGDDLWSGPLKRYLWIGLTRKYRGRGVAFSASEYAFFRRKTLSILNEMCLTARVRADGGEIVPLDPFPGLLSQALVIPIGSTELRPFQLLRRVVLGAAFGLQSLVPGTATGADRWTPLERLALNRLRARLRSWRDR